MENKNPYLIRHPEKPIREEKTDNDRGCSLVGSFINYQLIEKIMKPNEGKLRRNRQGQATALKTPEPVLFLIEMIEGDQNQLMAYYG